ncbi:MAG TPA: FAD-dependent oxidoreductase [Gemmatimonadaceae bacterium]|jgi:NADPH-dependent glutamate synthase beta subunit-like oxidoreductase/ferredoxin
MAPTNVTDPRYFHKVVDCQWACPAHTNVPQYLRLIGQGRYADSYLLNRESNVFPGILGRTCDRPCEPACRRGRVDDKPVAICRLKRVAADLRGDITGRLPKAPAQKNGKRVALVGAGPSSLTVANELLPLGYDVTIYEKYCNPGGLMRFSIPSFRLPASVIDEECGYIIDMGAHMKYETPVTSMRALLEEGYDAVFVGTGAPKGKDLEIPGRHDAPTIHVGLDWLAGVHFGHIESIERRVLIIGVGNTAMDCCRTSRRLGARDVSVVARRGRAHFKASPWELEDAEEEGVHILENHAPRRFIVENGVLTGMEFDQLRWGEDAAGNQASEVTGTVVIPCDAVILAIGQDNAVPWIEGDLGIEFAARHMPVVDKVTHQSTRPGVFFGGDAAFGPQNIIWAVAHGHQAAISIHLHCSGRPLTDRPPEGMTLTSTKLGMGAWEYSNDYNPSSRAKMQHEELVKRFSDVSVEVELGYTPEQAAREVERCLNCDIQTAFTDALCIECDACIDICPTSCLTITEERASEEELRQHLSAPARNMMQDLFVSGPLPQTKRLMVKDEDVCLHCGLCADRCPTAAWDMQRFDLKLAYAGVEAR